MSTYIQLVYFVFGCIFGSFLNVCIYRIPAKLSVAKGRSYCPCCKQTLRPSDMIPILSYIFLGGKCRFCKTRISLQYPVVELMTGAAFFLASLQYGHSVHTVLVCFFLCCLVVDGFIDFQTMELPNGVAAAICLAGLVRFLTAPGERISLLIGAVIISLPMLLLALFTSGFGGGDIKLCASAGLFLGFKAVILGAFIGCITGAVYGIILLLRKKAGPKTLFPFGPFLCFGFFMAALYAEPLLSFYFSSIVLTP